ncbi:MAG: hypothetical protein Q8R42_05220 [Desulfocapsaceae bacterium]|nr:hypothetical protein [Desulfocapsaceae bacterium]
MKIIACILLKILVTALSFVLIINIDSASAEYAMSKNDNAEMYYHFNSVETASSSTVTSQKNSDSGIIENKQEDSPAIIPTQLINKNEAVAPNNLESIQSTNAVLNCSASGNLDWTSSSGVFGVIRQCTMNVPEDGWVLIKADGSMARRSDGEYEALFRIGIDSTTGDSNIDRWVNVYNDSGDGTDKSMALSVIKPVTAGNHTFYFLGSRSAGSGTVMVFDPTLNVVFLPAQKMPNCSASGNMTWTTSSAAFSEMRQCTMNVPEDGWVLITADGSMARYDGEYEALFNIGIDSTTGDPDIDRWVNVYNDSGDGTDESVALSVMKPVTAGNHTFNFLGLRQAGSGTVMVYDPTLSVVALVWTEKFPWPMFLPAITNNAQP